MLLFRSPLSYVRKNYLRVEARDAEWNDRSFSRLEIAVWTQPPDTNMINKKIYNFSSLYQVSNFICAQLIYLICYVLVFKSKRRFRKAMWDFACSHIRRSQNFPSEVEDTSFLENYCLLRLLKSTLPIKYQEYNQCVYSKSYTNKNRRFAWTKLLASLGSKQRRRGSIILNCCVSTMLISLIKWP